MVSCIFLVLIVGWGSCDHPPTLCLASVNLVTHTRRAVPARLAVSLFEVSHARNKCRCSRFHCLHHRGVHHARITWLCFWQLHWRQQPTAAAAACAFCFSDWWLAGVRVCGCVCVCVVLCSQSVSLAVNRCIWHICAQETILALVSPLFLQLLTVRAPTK